MESIELVVIFEKASIQPSSIVNFFEGQLKRTFDCTFDELSYSLIESGTFKSKTVRYSQGNLSKLYKKNTLNGFELLRLLEGWKSKSKDVQFSVNYSRDFNEKCSCICVTINRGVFLERFEAQDVVGMFMEVVTFLRELLAELRYGFIFSMENTKFPSMYVAGIGNNLLTELEERDLQIWAEQNEHCDVAIWKLFWGNLITKRHLIKVENRMNIAELVGSEHFHEIDGSTFFFTLPGTDLSYNSKNSRLKDQILGLLNRLK